MTEKSSLTSRIGAKYLSEIKKQDKNAPKNKKLEGAQNRSSILANYSEIKEALLVWSMTTVWRLLVEEKKYFGTYQTFRTAFLKIDTAKSLGGIRDAQVKETVNQKTFSPEGEPRVVKETVKPFVYNPDKKFQTEG